MKSIFRQPVKITIFVIFVTSLFVPLFNASALKQLSIAPITWNVIGLDSNDENVGPNHFPVGARVCNTGDELVENVKSAFFFDSTDPYIDLRPGTSSAYNADGIDLLPTECVDFYYEVEVDRDSNAYGHTREYHITASADDTATVSTPQPRELFVEYLISQSRNSVSDVLLDGDSVPAGGTMNLVVGQTYEITLVGSTATNGYEQIESFINFPNTIFQVLDVITTYTADTSAYVDSGDHELYGDACDWENDPDNPNYQSCLDVGKVGGNISVTFDVRILSLPPAPLTNPLGLSTLIYDFSGSSYHYNSDYSVSTRFANIVTATLTKAFTPKTIHPGDDSTLTFEITNPGENAISDVNFDDALPSGISISSTTVTYDGCGGALPGTLSLGQTDLSFSNITIAGYGTCTIDVTVSGSTNGVYQNISNNLFIGTFDTGSSAADTLVISSSPLPPSSCPTPVTMATWTLENYTASTAFNTGSFNASSQAGDVTTAVGMYVPATGSNSAIVTSSTYPSGWDPPSTTGEVGNSWGIQGGWSSDGTPTDPLTEPTPYFQFQVDGSQYGGVGLTTSYNLQNNWSNSGDWFVLYSTDGSTWSVLGTAQWSNSNAWQIDAISATSTSTGDPTIYFRVFAAGAQYTGPAPQTTHAEMYLDNITITGCPNPDVPTLSKAFTDASIPTGTTTTLTFSLANPNSTDLNGVGFTDDLPAGLLIATPNGLSQSCSVGSLTGGTITATSDTTYFELDNATLSANAVCTISIAVLGDVAGDYENISGSITSTETGPNTTTTGYGIDTLTVVDPPVISKSFGATFVLTGNTTTLSFSITNPNRTVALTGVAFTDDLPDGLDIADGTFSVCGGTDNLTTASAGDIITLSSTTIAASGTCEFSVTVTGSTVGTYVNTTGNVTSTNGGTGNTATATIEVRDSEPLISLDKLVSDSGTDPWGPFVSVGTSSNVWFRFVVENIGDEPLTSVDVTDPAPYVDPSTCVWTDGDGDSLSAPFTLPVPTADNDNHIAICTIGPITSSATVGSYSNTATASGTGTSVTVTDDSTATYANPEVTIVKTALPAYYLASGEVISYSFDVTNTGGVPLLGPITVADDRATNESCPSVTTVGDGDNYLDPVDHLNPGDPAESITCTASYTIVAGDVSAGSVTNNATATVDSIASNTDSETVYLAALTIDKDTSTPTVGANGLVVYTIEVVNTGQYDLANFQITDTLPFVGGEYSVQSTSASVTSGTINANGSYDGSGDTNLLAGADTLLAGATATITINIQLSGATAATYDNTAVAITDETGSIDDDGIVADDPGTPGSGADPETDEDVTVIAGGTITIIKDSVPDDAQDFSFSGSGPAGYNFGGGFSLDDDADPTLLNTQSFTGLSPGSYTLTEGAISGWGLTGLSCVDPDSGSSVDLGTRTATIDLDAGETVTCTYTNSPTGTIIIIKDSQPDDAQDFDFTGSGPSGYDFGGGFSLDDDSDVTLPNIETFSDLIPGSYSVTEGVVAGWDLTALSCVDPDGGSSTNLGTLTASIDLDSGETVTCTFTNTQRGTIIIVKDSVPDDGQDFGFTGSGPSGYDFGGGFSLDDDTDPTLLNSATFINLVPGSYSVSEAAVSGWDLTALSCVDPDSGSSTNVGTRTASIDLDPGETVTCTYNNTQRGTIIIVKDSVPDDGQDFGFTGSGPAGYDFGGGFSLDDDSDVTLPNSLTFSGLTPGSYSVTEAAVSSWGLNGLICTDPDSGSTVDLGTRTATIDLDPGETVTCTFTNSQQGTIIIVKDSVPDDAQDFGFTGSGPSGYDFGGGFSLDDDSDVTLPNTETFSDLIPGSYTLTEAVVSGWDLTALSCVDPDGGSSGNVGTRTASIDLDPGETITCTYTNTQQGTIIIDKDSVPDDAQDFAFTGSGPSGYNFGGGFSLDDDTDGTLPNSQTFSGLAPGSYSVTEASVSGWDLTALSCVDPDGGSSTNVGTRTASIDLDPGETITCTYTNTQLGTIVIFKDSVPNDAQDFDFTGTGPSGFDFGGGFSLDDDTDGTLPNNIIFPNRTSGSYTLTEAAVFGWELTGLSCTDPDSGSTVDLGTRTATIDLDPGEIVTCTFTNSRGGTLVILKNAVPDAAQDFDFTGSGPSGFDFGGGFSLDDDADGTLPNNIIFPGLTSGSYTLTEAAVSGWDLSALSCVDPDGGSSTNVGTRTASIDIDPNETVTCTFTNTQQGTIVIVKDSVPDDGQDFGFTGSGPAGYDFGGGFSLDDDSDVTLPNTETFSDLIPGSYTLTEAAVSGWDLTALSCVDPDGGSSTNVGTRTASIDLDPGETITCTYTNTQQGTIIIDKDSVPDDAQDFAFTGSGPSGYNFGGGFSLDDDADGTLPNSQTFSGLAPGSYSVTEASVSGWDLTALSCIDPDAGSSTNVGTRTASIDLDPGETVSCTYTNTQQGAITIIKDAVPDDAQDFDFSGSGPSGYDFGGGFSLDDDTDGALPSTQTFSGLTPGSYAVTEAAVSGWDLTGLSCTDPDGGSITDLGTLTASIDLDPGEGITCSFTNTLQNPAITLVKSIVSGVSYDTVGDVISYQFVITNSGNVTLTGPFSVVDDRVTNVICPAAATLDPNESITCTATYIIVQADIDNGSVTNTATASGFFGGNTVTSNQDSQTANATIIDPAITKTGDPATAQVGDTVTFTLNVFNNGNTPAIDVVVTDPLPAFLDYVGTSAPGSALIDYDQPTNTVTVYYSTVQPLPTDYFTITITTVVNSLGAPPGGTNTATVDSLSADADPTNNFDSAVIQIIEVSGLPSPDTGFAPGQISEIPLRPQGFSYFKLGELTLQIPTLDLETTIVGVPLTEDGWDVTWLWDQVGYLDGSAFPGWNGNSVLTGHVYLPNGLPGPFISLDQLFWGDQVFVEVSGTRYTYEVRETHLYTPDDNRIIRHEDSPWLTLITCQGFDEQSGEYRWRRVVRAVLIEVE